ncbi:MAG: glycoside hydrolase family 127 protein [Clostridia bacterium]|nr:glycoside hydrolase family 127 protein [Clostridia bacterium]
MLRHAYDKQFDLPAGSVSLRGITEEKIRIITEGTLKVIDMHALADYFRNTMDMFATGEFWGKLMRASCLICSYTGDSQLRAIVDEAARDMLSLQREDGCLSTCPDHTQPNGSNGSDLWERKYALMGLLAYYELTGSTEALDACVRLVRYTNSQVGKHPKTPITKTGWAFAGIESSSILEPVLRVYHITGEPAALELGTYIVESGCCDRENIFEAIRAGKSPMEIGWNGVAEQSIAKAYEMMSCFEGLCEYHRATGDMQALETVKLFWDKVMEEEITLLGSGGADAPYNLGPGTGEQWNRTRFEQTNPDIDFMMETCVTIYWMRLCHQLLRLTGEVKYADELEKSLYNAIFGALKPDGRFFEYFPRFNGARNPKVNYSFNIRGFDLSCCTANGPTGLGMAPYLAFSGTPDGVAINLYENGKVRVPFGEAVVTLAMESDYPMMGKATLKVVAVEGSIPAEKPFIISLRVPGFAEDFTVLDSARNMVTGEAGTYLRLCGNITAGDEWLICFDIPLVKHPAPHGSNRAGDHFVAFTYGSVLLARDGRDGVDPLTPITDGEIGDWRITPSKRDGFLTAYVSVGGTELKLIDYMTAGNDWQGTEFASWIPTK